MTSQMILQDSDIEERRMTRYVKLEGKDAGYKRLSLIGEAEQYGVDIPDTATAPFNIMWDHNLNTAFVCFGKTRVARLIHTDKLDFFMLRRDNPDVAGNPGFYLMLRQEFPKKHKDLLIRAIDNMVEYTDEIGKIKRSVERENKGTGKNLTTRTPTDYTVAMSRDEFIRACFGAELIERKMFLQKISTNLVEVGTRIISSSDGTFKPFAQGMTKTYGDLNEEAFIPLLERGKKIWGERITTEDLIKSMDEVLALPDMDHKSIDETFWAAMEADNLENPNKKASIGKMTAVVKGNEAGLYLNGIRVYADIGLDQDFLNDSFGEAVDLDRLRVVHRNMTSMVMLGKLGHEPSDYPMLTEELIKQKIDDADFGYHM